MKRLGGLMAALLSLALLCACASKTPQETPAATPEFNTTEEQPTAPVTAVPTSESPIPTEAPGGWANLYTAFLDDNYDIISALWPEGLTGVGFIDLDLDGMPEMVLFDMGASATLGVQLFDCVDGQVVCVSSVHPDAAGAFGGGHMSPLSICTSYFESFRLVQDEDGTTCFSVVSANGSLESSWEEVIRFGCDENGYLTLWSVCYRDCLYDVETDQLVAETFEVGGVGCSEEEYTAARAASDAAHDLGYEAAGVFLWSDMTRYDITYDGLVAMACDAAEAYRTPEW